MSILLLAVLPVEAPKPAATAYYAQVDLIVINRVRSHTTSYDEWGRPRHRFSEQWWVSFWDILWVPAAPLGGVLPAGWIDRGWWSSSNCVGISPCSDGWVVESKNGLNVVAKKLWVIDSPFDWEVKHRKLYRPLKKP